MLLLRVIVAVPCESVDEAAQTALDMEFHGSVPLEVTNGERVVLDGNALRRQMIELGTN